MVILSWVGSFDETAIVDYRLSFADQGKQTSVFRFRLQRTVAVFFFRLQQINGVACFS
jgi:hypothetical protein